MIKTVLEKWLKVIGEEEPLPGLTMDHLLPVFAHRILERLEKSLFQVRILTAERTSPADPPPWL